MDYKDNITGAMQDVKKKLDALAIVLITIASLVAAILLYKACVHCMDHIDRRAKAIWEAQQSRDSKGEKYKDDETSTTSESPLPPYQATTPGGSTAPA